LRCVRWISAAASQADQKTIQWIVFPTNALALIVQTELKLDPHSGVTIVFRSKRGDRLKVLVWDGTGLVMVCKVLEQGSFALGEDRFRRDQSVQWTD